MFNPENHGPRIGSVFQDRAETATSETGKTPRSEGPRKQQEQDRGCPNHEREKKLQQQQQQPQM